jgi:hypothetical protein
MTTATIDPPAVELASLERCGDSTVVPRPNKTILRAARLANFNGWTTGVIAALSAPFAFFSLVGGLVFVSLAVVAINEFRGRRRLLKLDPAAASLLGWNQLGLLALVIGYCCWMIFTGLTTMNPVAAELAANPDLAAVLGAADGFDALYRQVVVGFYGVVIVLSAVFQGINAVYYFTRRKHVERNLREMPMPAGKIRRTTMPG